MKRANTHAHHSFFRISIWNYEAIQTVMNVSAVVVQGDDLHPLLAVQIEVQFLRAQLQTRRAIILKV